MRNNISKDALRRGRAWLLGVRRKDELPAEFQRNEIVNLWKRDHPDLPIDHCHAVIDDMIRKEQIVDLGTDGLLAFSNVKPSERGLAEAEQLAARMNDGARGPYPVY